MIRECRQLLMRLLHLTSLRPFPSWIWICNEAEASTRQTSADPLSPFFYFSFEPKTITRGCDRIGWNVSVLLVVGHWLYATNKWLTDGLIDLTDDRLYFFFTFVSRSFELSHTVANASIFYRTIPYRTPVQVTAIKTPSTRLFQTPSFLDNYIIRLRLLRWVLASKFEVEPCTGGFFV